MEWLARKTGYGGFSEIIMLDNNIKEAVKVELTDSNDELCTNNENSDIINTNETKVVTSAVLLKIVSIIVSLVCFTVLAVVFKHWWIVLFAALFMY